MKPFSNRLIHSCLLATTALAPLAAQDEDVIHLAADRSTQTLRVAAGIPGFVFLMLGELADPPIPIGGIVLNVAAREIVPLGEFQGGTVAPLFVPRVISDLHAEAILFDPSRLVLFDSNVVALEDAFPDLIDASFRAVVVSTDDIPPQFTLGASLTAPTSGHEFLVDSQHREGDTTHVYLRLITPTEPVPQVLTRHELTVDLGSEVGSTVRVYLMRIPRGQTAPEVYKLMAVRPTGNESR